MTIAEAGKSALVVLITTALLSCSHPGTGGELVVCDFSSSPEGWQVAGDTGPGKLAFHASGGRSGGYISYTDDAVGETWYFQAPAGVLKNLAAAEGGRLEYRLKVDIADGAFPDDDVVIVGPAGRLSYRFDHSPGTDWTDFSVALAASANWRWNWNARATQEQIHAVLSQPLRLEIRGEFRTGDDTGGMDDFVLTTGK